MVTTIDNTTDREMAWYRNIGPTEADVYYGDFGVQISWHKKRPAAKGGSNVVVPEPEIIRVDPGPTTPKIPPPLPVLGLTSNAWGQPMPVGFGMRRVKGAVIWLSRARRDESLVPVKKPYTGPSDYYTKRWRDTGLVEPYNPAYQNAQYRTDAYQSQFVYAFDPGIRPPGVTAPVNNHIFDWVHIIYGNVA